MTLPLKIKVRKNGGAPQVGPIAGGLSVAAGDVITLDLVDNSGLGTVVFKIVDFPPEFPCPAGWIVDGVSYVCQSFAPPPFTIHNVAGSFGNFTISAVCDGGTKIDVKGNVVPDPNKFDNTLGLSLYPAGIIMRDTAWQEEGQIDQGRMTAAAVKHNWRVIQAFISAGGVGGSSTGTNLGGATAIYAGNSGSILQFRTVRGLNGITISVVGGEVHVDGAGVGSGVQSQIVTGIAPNATYPTLTRTLPDGAFLTSFSLVKSLGSGSGTFAMELWGRDATNTMVLITSMASQIESLTGAIGQNLVHPFKMGSPGTLEIRAKAGVTGNQSHGLNGLFQYVSTSTVVGGGGGGLDPLVTDAAQGDMPAIAGLPYGHLAMTLGGGIVGWHQLNGAEVLNASVGLTGSTVTAVALYEKAQRVKTPEDYGAIGNGIADDSGALNALYAANKQWKHGLNKVYGVANTVTVPATAIGDGAGSQILRLPGMSNATNVVSMTGAPQLVNWSVDGNHGGNVGHNIVSSGLNGARFTNCASVNPGVANPTNSPCAMFVTGSNLQNCVFSNFDMHQDVPSAGSGSFGLYVLASSPMTSVRFFGGTLNKGFKTGFFPAAGGAKDVQLWGTDISEGTVHGPQIGYASIALEYDITFFGCRFFNNPWCGIVLTGASGAPGDGNYGVKCYDCHMSYCAGDGASIGQAGVHLQNNTFEWHGGSITKTGVDFATGLPRAFGAYDFLRSATASEPCDMVFEGYTTDCPDGVEHAAIYNYDRLEFRDIKVSANSGINCYTAHVGGDAISSRRLLVMDGFEITIADPGSAGIGQTTVGAATGKGETYIKNGRIKGPLGGTPAASNASTGIWLMNTGKGLIEDVQCENFAHDGFCSGILIGGRSIQPIVDGDLTIKNLTHINCWNGRWYISVPSSAAGEWVFHQADNCVGCTVDWFADGAGAARVKELGLIGNQKIVKSAQLPNALVATWRYGDRIMGKTGDVDGSNHSLGTAFEFYCTSTGPTASPVWAAVP